MDNGLYAKFLTSKGDILIKLKSGDIINIDVTVIKDGYHGDTSRMFLVGKTSTLSNRLCEVTRKSMIEGIK